MGVAAALAIIVIGLIIYQVYQNKQILPVKEASAEGPSIAVLPFDNMSDDPEQEYFSNGISDNLITDLSKVPNFLVISRNTSFGYKGKSLSIEQIAKELDVRYVLEGSVQKADNLVRINVQLIDGTTGHHLWAERYDGSTSDIFALQDKITQKIATSLAVKLTDDEQQRIAQKGTTNIEAYEAFLKGYDLANYIRMDPEGLAKSIPWFEKATELDPDFSRAYAALAESYVRGSVGLLKRLGISSRLARLRALNYLRIAMKNPTDIAYRNIARLYITRRRHEKGVDHAMKAIAIDPNDADNNSVMALTLINSGRPDEAIDFIERMRRTDPACLF
jgi:TolB-like protein